MGRRTTKTTTKTTSITKAAKATTSCCVWLSYLLVTDALLPCNFSHTAYYNFLSLSGGRHSGCYSRTGIASSQRATFQDVSVRYDSALKFQRQLFGRCYDSSSGSTARRYPHQSSQNESFSIGNEEYDDWLVQNLLDEWANSKKQDRSIEKMTEKLTNLRWVEAQKRSSGNSSWSTRNNNLNNSNPDEDQQSWQQIQRSMISYSTRSTNNSNEMPPPNDKKTLQNFSPPTGISTLTSLVALRYNLVNRPSVKEEELQDVSRRTDLEIPTHYYPDRFLFEKAVRDLDRWKENQEAWKKGMVMSGAAGVMAMGMVAGTIEGANAMVGTVEDEGRILMASQSSGVVGSGSSFSSISHTVSSGKTDTKGAPSSSSSFASSSPIVRSDFASAVPVEEKNSESVVIDHDSDDTSRTFTATNLNEQTVTGAIDNNENHMASSAADPSTSSPPIIAVNNINEVLLTETNTPSLTSATTMKDHAAMTQRLQTLWSAISSTSEELDNLYSELDNLEEEYSMNDVASSRQAAAVATTYRPASQTTIPQDDDPIFRAWSTRSDDDVDMSTGEDENRMKSSSMTTASTSIPTTEPIAHDSTGPMFRVWSGQNDDDNGVISTEEETRYVHSSSAMNAAASIPTPEPATLENSGPMFRVWSRQSDDDIDVRFSEDETSNIRSSSMTTATASVPTSEPAVQKNSGPMFRVWSRQPDDDFSVRLSEESSSNIRSLSTTTATASVPTSEPAVQENSGPMFRVWSKKSDDDIHVNFREDESGSNIRSSSMTTTTASIPTSEPSVQENSGPMFRVWSRQSDDDFSVRLSEESSSNIRSSSTTTATASIPTPEPAARRGSGPMFRVWSSQSDDNIAVDFREEIISTRSPNAATVTTSASASTPAPDPAFQKNSGPMFHVWSKQSDDDFAVSLGEQDSISQSSSVSTSIASVPTTETEIGQGNGPLFHEWGTQSDDGIIVKIEDENYIGSSSTVVASVDASSLVTSDNEADAMRGPQEQFWSSQEGDDFAVTLNESNIAEKSGAEAATIYTEAPSDNDPLSPYSIRYDGRTRRGEFGTISGFESPIVTKTAEDAFVRSSSAIKAFEKDDISASNREKSSIQFGADLNNVVDVYAAIIKRDERAAKDAISGISSEAVGFAVGLAGSAIADRTVSLRRQSNAN